MLTIGQTLKGLKTNYYLVDYETGKSLGTLIWPIIPRDSNLPDFLEQWFAHYDQFDDRWYFGCYKNAKNAMDFINAQLMAAQLADPELITVDEEDTDDDDWTQL